MRNCTSAAPSPLCWQQYVNWFLMRALHNCPQTSCTWLNFAVNRSSIIHAVSTCDSRPQVTSQFPQVASSIKLQLQKWIWQSQLVKKYVESAVNHVDKIPVYVTRVNSYRPNSRHVLFPKFRIDLDLGIHEWIMMIHCITERLHTHRAVIAVTPHERQSSRLDQHWQHSAFNPSNAPRR